MRKLIRIMALALEVEETFFDKKITYPIASVRCLHYPPQNPNEENETGLGAHTDIQSKMAFLDVLSIPVHADS